MNKNTVLCGGTLEHRQAYISQARDAFLKQYPSARIFTLSEHIGDSERYLKSVRKEFPIEPSLSLDQINDSYLDWVQKHKSVLVIIPELQKLYKRAPEYFYQLMGDYMATQQSLLAQSTLRFLITLNEPLAIDIHKIPVLIGGSWRPTEKDLDVVALPLG